MNTVESASDVSQVILAWTMFFINIYTVYVIESEVANFVQSPTLHHLTGILTLIIISNHKENGSVMALISLDTWKKGGDLEEGYKIGHYVEGIKVRCTEVCDVICVLFLLLFRLFYLQ